METSIAQNTTSQTYISEFAVLIKKMRLVRKLRRKQAAHFLPFDHKNIEKLENGRGNISVEQFKMFQSTYGFSDSELEALRLGKYKAIEKAQEPKQKSKYFSRYDQRYGSVL